MSNVFRSSRGSCGPQPGAEPGSERRIIPRYPTSRPAQISLDGGRRVSCTVRDLSTSGACLEAQDPDGLPDTFMLAIQGMGMRHKCKVAWRTKDRIGVEFR